MHECSSCTRDDETEDHFRELGLKGWTEGHHLQVRDRGQQQHEQHGVDEAGHNGQRLTGGQEGLEQQLRSHDADGGSSGDSERSGERGGRHVRRVMTDVIHW